MIQHPNARQSENAMAYDNAVSAVGKICQFHRDSIDSSQVAMITKTHHVFVWLFLLINKLTFLGNIRYFLRG